MTELFSLGKLYVSDFLADGEQPRAEPADLTLMMDDDTGIVHLAEQPDASLMWGTYWYRSSTSQTMRDELGDIVASIGKVVKPDVGDVWVDIACNDGTLLGNLPDEIIKIGVDPVEGDIHRQATEVAEVIVQAPFTETIGRSIARTYGPAKVVTCIAMFYDLTDPTDFLAGVKRLLADDGMFVLQLAYTPLMLQQLAFDSICHEHARYYTLTTLTNVLQEAGFWVEDCTLNDTNGGSMRVYCTHAGNETWGTQPRRDVGHFNVAAILDYENRSHHNETYQWENFRHRLAELRRDVTRFVTQAKERGETVWCLGASTKGNTLLQYFGFDHTMIDAICERQPGKVGLRTVGTDIPIRSEADFRAARPDYAIVLPWHFRAEIVEREADYLAGGGRLVFPCPRFEIVGDGPAMLDGQRPA